MNKFFIAITILLSSILSQAQNSGVTIFSEEGELFYVILDGERQNNTPSANVKIENLTRPNYKVKIVFDNADIKDLNKNLFVTDMDEKSYHSVYMIYKNKKGEMDWKLSSYNEAKSKPSQSKEPIIKQETILTNPSDKIDVKVEAMGTKINVNLDGIQDLMVVDELMGGTKSRANTTTTTTTTTTTSSNSHSNHPSDHHQQSQPKAGCQYAMSNNDFSKGKASIAKQSFSESMMKTAKQMTKVNCLSLSQIREVIKMFSFENSKLEYAKYAYEYCVEKKNYYQLSDAFSFSSSSDSLNEFLESQQ